MISQSWLKIYQYRGNKYDTANALW